MVNIFTYSQYWYFAHVWPSPDSTFNELLPVVCVTPLVTDLHATNNRKTVERQDGTNPTAADFFGLDIFGRNDTTVVLMRQLWTKWKHEKLVGIIALWYHT